MLKFAAIDRVTSIVPGTIRHIPDLRGVIPAIAARSLAVEQLTDRFHDLDIWLLVQAADIVGLADAAFLQHEPDRGGVIFDIEPVADLHAVPVDGEGFSL